MEKKVVKVIRYYEDGSSESIESVNLSNYLDNLDIANSIVGSRSYISFKPVEWTEENGSRPPVVGKIIGMRIVEHDFSEVVPNIKEKITVEDAIVGLSQELKKREDTFIKAYNIIENEDEFPVFIDERDVDSFEDEISICELYHQIKSETYNNGITKY